MAQWLPLIRDTLHTAEGHIRQYNTDGIPCTAIKPTVESFKEKAKHLRDILQGIAPEPDPSRIQRYCLAVRRLGREGQVEELMKGMLEDVHLLVGNQAIKAAMEAQAASFGRPLKTCRGCHHRYQVPDMSPLPTTGQVVSSIIQAAGLRISILVMESSSLRIR